MIGLFIYLFIYCTSLLYYTDLERFSSEPHGRVKQLEHDSDSERQKLGHDQGALHLYKTRQQDPNTAGGILPLEDKFIPLI